MVIAVLGFAEPSGLAQAMTDVAALGATTELVAITYAGIDVERGAAVGTGAGLSRSFFSRWAFPNGVRHLASPSRAVTA
jgi:hypothetical protein